MLTYKHGHQSTHALFPNPLVVRADKLPTLTSAGQSEVVAKVAQHMSLLLENPKFLHVKNSTACVPHFIASGDFVITMDPDIPWHAQLMGFGVLLSVTVVLLLMCVFLPFALLMVLLQTIAICAMLMQTCLGIPFVLARAAVQVIRWMYP